jgi:hypothetical protein
MEDALRIGSGIYVVDRTQSATGGPCAMMRSVLGIGLSIYDWSTTGLQKKRVSEYNTLDYSSHVFDRVLGKNGSKLIWCGHIPAHCWRWNDLCL